MKKILLLTLIIIMFTGCSSKSDQEIENEKLKKYNAAVEAVINNRGALSTTIPFTYTASVEELSDEIGTYHYTVVIDEPQIAMYDVEIIIVDLNQLDTGNIFPSAGIVDESDTLIPYQVNAAKGFPKGIVLDGITDTTEFQLEVMVSWKDYSKLNVYYAYFPIIFSNIVPGDIDE